MLDRHSLNLMLISIRIHLYPFCLNHFLDIKAEILQIFQVNFWAISDSINSLMDILKQRSNINDIQLWI